MTRSQIDGSSHVKDCISCCNLIGSRIIKPAPDIMKRAEPKRHGILWHNDIQAIGDRASNLASKKQDLNLPLLTQAVKSLTLPRDEESNKRVESAIAPLRLCSTGEDPEASDMHICF